MKHFILIIIKTYTSIEGVGQCRAYVTSFSCRLGPITANRYSSLVMVRRMLMLVALYRVAPCRVTFVIVSLSMAKV